MQIDTLNPPIDDLQAWLREEMIEAFGLPRISTDSVYREVHGLYHCYDHTCYWVHDPQTESWHVSTNEAGVPIALIDDEWCDADRAEVSALMGELRWIAPPPTPAHLNKSARTEPFLFEGWLFAHYYFPELKRWELAPVCRR